MQILPSVVRYTYLVLPLGHIPGMYPLRNRWDLGVSSAIETEHRKRCQTGLGRKVVFPPSLVPQTPLACDLPSPPMSCLSSVRPLSIDVLTSASVIPTGVHSRAPRVNHHLIDLDQFLNPFRADPKNFLQFFSVINHVCIPRTLWRRSLSHH